MVSQMAKWRAAEKVCDAVSALFFGAMFVMFVVEVFFRYVLDAPIGWSIEFILIAFLVMLFWTATFNVPLKKHVAFTVLYEALPPGGRRVLRLVTDVIGIAILVPAYPGILKIVAYENGHFTPMLHMPLSVLYGGYALFLASFVIRLAASAVGLFQPGWQERL